MEEINQHFLTLTLKEIDSPLLDKIISADIYASDNRIKVSLCVDEKFDENGKQIGSTSISITTELEDVLLEFKKLGLDISIKDLNCYEISVDYPRKNIAYIQGKIREDNINNILDND